jgi:polyribonucleotide nucleotidyltransferase
LAQAKEGRNHILAAMYEVQPAHRADVKPHAPRMIMMFIEKEFIGAIIGPGGKVIQEMQKVTGTTINIEEKNERGEVSIFGTNKEGVSKAEAWIKGIVMVPTEGEIYEATVKSIMPYGAFVEFLPGKQGLLHISEVTWKRLDTLEGILKEGDMVKVKLVGTDPKTGKFKLSRKVLLPKPEGIKPASEEAERM